MLVEIELGRVDFEPPPRYSAVVREGPKRSTCPVSLDSCCPPLLTFTGALLTQVTAEPGWRIGPKKRTKKRGTQKKKEIEKKGEKKIGSPKVDIP